MDEGTKPTESRSQSHMIKRPRLTKLLDDSGARVILLVAPAGYGKTTLAREWLAAYQRPVAWFRASAASADVAALATGLAVEIDTAVADGETLSMNRMASLTAVQQRPDVLARALARSRTDWPKQFVVAMDDYHQVSASEAAERFIGELVSLLPATFVITTRARPNWFTPRQAVYGEAVEVGTAELAMTESEAREVFEASSRSALRASAFEIARGWPVVIGLAARTGRTDFPRQALPRSLYEFLADDLVQAVTPDTQRALTVLALCGANERALARELLGPSADVGLSEAEKRGLLTLEGSTGLVLHPLLSEFLIQKLRESGTGAIAEVIDPLIGALVDSRRWDECLAVAEAVAETSTHAAGILENSLQELLSSGRVETVRRWVALARSANLSDPIVELAEAEVALRAGEYDRALVLGGRAAGRLASREKRSRAELAAGRAAHLADHPVAAKSWFRAAEASAGLPEVRAAALWGQLLGAHEDESGDFDHALERLAAAGDGSVDHEIRLALGRLLAAHTSANCGFAIEGIETVLALVPLSTDPLLRLTARNHCAWTLVFAARYTQAVEVADAVINDAEASGAGFAVNHGLLAKANALVGLRQFAASRQIGNRVTSRLRQEADRWTATNLAIHHARLQISLGDIERAADHLALDPERPLHASNRAEYDAYRALIDAARGKRSTAAMWIERSLGTSHNIESCALAWIAQAALATECPTDALRCFELTLRSGHLDAIVIGCRAQPELAKLIARDEQHVDTLRAILLASNDEPLARAAGLHVPRTYRRAEWLSPRELEVYELMIQGRTNREIAASLFITESTTKVHVRHILEKLGVRSRVEAVRAWRPTVSNSSDLDDSG